jgi:hypothetical protein
MAYKVTIGNWTQYVKDFVQGKDSASFIIGQTGGGNKDPAYGCGKQFNATYQCGNGKTKTININPEAWGQAAEFDCTQEVKACKEFKLTLGDDGNIVLTDSNNQTIWSSNTNKTGIANPAYSASNGKYKRNYLLSSETLALDEFIGSPSGNCYLIMTPDGLQLKYSVSACTMTDANTGYGNDDNTFALYSVSKINKSDLGKVGHISNDGILHPYPDNMVTLGTSYSLIGNFDSPNNTIKTLENTSIEECKSECNKDDNCYGFVYNPYQKQKKVQYIKIYYPEGRGECIQISQLAVFSNGVNVAQGKPATSLNVWDDKNTTPLNVKPENAVDGTLSVRDYRTNSGYHSKCLPGDFWMLDLQYEYPVQKVVYYNRGDCCSDRAIGMNIDLMDKNKTLLKTIKLNGDATQSFDIDIEEMPKDGKSGNQCMLKNSNTYPKGLRQENNEFELYVRNKGVKNNESCSKDVEPVSLATWGSFTPGDSMTMDTLCSLGAITKDERKTMEEKKAKLKETSEKVNNKVNDLTSERRNLLSKMNNNVDKMGKNINSYKDVENTKQANKMGEPSINGMLQDSDLNMISQRNKQQMWSILAILAVIGGIRIARSMGSVSE